MPVTLVVEDDSTIADVLSYHLERAGHDVTVARDGAEAVAQLRARAFDLVILDLMLPRLPGPDVLRLLRREASTPVIVVSARDTNADQIALLELGADDYITKPFSVRQLLARVAAVLRRSGVAAPSAPTGGAALVIDEVRHEVRRHGEVVELSPKEFDLLAYLARHADQACSRDVLLDAVWGYEFRGQTRTVDVHIHWLRRKIEDDPARPRLLRTVRQLGYRLVARDEDGTALVDLVAARRTSIDRGATGQ